MQPVPTSHTHSIFPTSSSTPASSWFILHNRFRHSFISHSLQMIYPPLSIFNYFIFYPFLFRSRDSAVGIATGWTAEGRSSNPGRGKIFLLSTSSRLALGPTQPPTEWVLGATFPVVKRSGREAVHSPSSTEVRNT
jgi:hypothetical protein